MLFPPACHINHIAIPQSFPLHYFHTEHTYIKTVYCSYKTLKCWATQALSSWICCHAVLRSACWFAVLCYTITALFSKADLGLCQFNDGCHWVIYLESSGYLQFTFQHPWCFCWTINQRPGQVKRVSQVHVSNQLCRIKIFLLIPVHSSLSSRCILRFLWSGPPWAPPPGWTKRSKVAAVSLRGVKMRTCRLENQNNELREAKNLFRADGNYVIWGWFSVGLQLQVTPLTLHLVNRSIANIENAVRSSRPGRISAVICCVKDVSNY